MARRNRRTERKRQPFRPLARLSDPYLAAWMALKPAERLRRAWRLRSRLKNPQAVHDAKSLPEL